MADIRETRYAETLTMRLRPDDAKRIREAAAADDRPPSSFARRVILQSLDKQAAPGSPDPVTAA